MKIRGIISNDLNHDKYYPEHDSEQHSRSFSRRSDTLRNAKCWRYCNFQAL